MPMTTDQRRQLPEPDWHEPAAHVRESEVDTGRSFVRVLGSGGFGQVYEVMNRATGEREAMKKALKQHVPKVRKFVHEAHVMCILSGHENLVSIRGFFVLESASDRPTYCLVFMELLSHSLKSAATPWRSPEQAMITCWTPRMAAYIALMAARGLEFMHRKGFVHWDFKPDNVLIKWLEQPCHPRSESDFDPGKLAVKICDFGGATKRFSGEMGSFTPGYMSPETCAYHDAMKHRATRKLNDFHMLIERAASTQDVWSWGVVLQEMLLNKRRELSVEPLVGDQDKRPLEKPGYAVLKESELNQIQANQSAETVIKASIRLVKRSMDKFQFRRPVMATIVEQLAPLSARSPRNRLGDLSVPDRVTLFYNMGKAFQTVLAGEQTNDSNCALMYYERCAVLIDKSRQDDPQQGASRLGGLLIDTRIGIVETKMQQGELDLAKESLDKAFSLEELKDNEKAKLYITRGSLLHAEARSSEAPLDRLKEAVEDYEKALDLLPRIPLHLDVPMTRLRLSAALTAQVSFSASPHRFLHSCISRMFRENTRLMGEEEEAMRVVGKALEELEELGLEQHPICAEAQYRQADLKIRDSPQEARAHAEKCKEIARDTLPEGHRFLKERERDCDDLIRRSRERGCSCILL